MLTITLRIHHVLSVLSVEYRFSTELSAIKWRKDGYISRETSLAKETVGRTYIRNI